MRSNARKASRAKPWPSAERAPALLALVALLAPACERDASSEPRDPPPAAADLARDPRIDYLLVPGARTDHYDVDTSDPLAILEENLLHGQRDPLRRAREELAEHGEAGLRVVRRVIETYFDHPEAYAHLRNAMDVVLRSDLPQARELSLLVLRHPADDLKKIAVEGLQRHGEPRDYDAVRALFDTISPEFRSVVANALWDIDRMRGGAQYLDWIEAGEHPGGWEDFAARLAEAEDPRLVARLAALWPRLPPRDQALCAAPCARAGDDAALQFLRGELESPEAWRAEIAVIALSKSGLEDELDRVARAHPGTRARMLAINALAAPAAAARHVDALRAGLTAEDETVANACLVALAAIGDSAAIDRALEALHAGDPVAAAKAMEALRPRLQADPALARRVLDALVTRHDPESGRPLDEQVQLLRSIGQVPLREAAELLYGLSETARGEIQGLRASHWLLQQVGNVGEPGQRLLAERLAGERDPLRRIDLIEGLALRGGPLALETLLRLAESDGVEPYELLYVADRLTRLGTVEEVAPVLKRAVLRVQQPDVRVALQSLLWTHYPGRR
jgi:hypothetical protein